MSRDHHGLLFAVLARRLSAAVKRLVRTILLRRISPVQAIGIDEDNPAGNPPVINARLAMRLGEEGGQACNLLVALPEEIA